MLGADTALKGIFTLGQTIYAQVQLVRANRQQCARLNERIQVVITAVKDLEKARDIRHYEAGLNALHTCLESCAQFIDTFTSSTRLELYLLKAKGQKEHFEKLNEALQKAVQQLNLGLAAQQMVNHLHDEADRKADSQALLALQHDILAHQESMLHEMQALKLDEAELHRIVALQVQSIKQHLLQQAPPKSPVDERLSIPFNELAFDTKIMETPTSHLYQGRLYEQTVAIKLFNTQLNSKMLERFQREVAILSRLPHPHIIQCLGMAVQGSQAALIMEYAPKGTLLEVLNTTPSRERCHAWALQLAKAMHYLHAQPQPIWHRQLNPTHILLNKDDTLKLTGFGLSKVQDTAIHTATSSSTLVAWMAPEYMARQPLTDKSDVYSYGLVLWMLLTGDVPYEGLSEDALIAKVHQGQHPPISSFIPPAYAHLLQSCWHLDPAQRPPFKRIIKTLEANPLCSPEDIYLKGIEWEQRKKEGNALECEQKAYDCYQQAAEGGYAKAYTNLGLFSLKGRAGQLLDKAKAYALFLKGAEGGHVRAMMNVATMLEHGDGVKQNIEEALRWYQQAAKAGESTAAAKYQSLLEEHQPRYQSFDASVKLSFS